MKPQVPDMGEEAPKMPLAKMIQAVSIALGVLSKKESWLDILKHFERRLPEKPDWVVLVTDDFRTVASGNVDTSHEERDPTVFISSQLSLAEHIIPELRIGQFKFSLISGNKGLFITIPIHDDFFLGVKFNKQLEISSLGSLGHGLSAALEELSFKLKDK
jgi:predicted regulator of Ras-like GTPase activity (Roadblock/LC7/MglB family)